MLELNLDDSQLYVRFHSFKIEKTFTYGNGERDKSTRELVRAAAYKDFPAQLPNVDWWAFRIYVRKPGRQRFDVDNVAKCPIDAFSQILIQDDESEYRNLALYQDDTIDSVRIVEVAAERVQSGEMGCTTVEIFGRRTR